MNLCVPILAIFFVYMQAESTVKNQIILSNQNTLNQFFRLMDSVTEEMRNICISVAGDTECVNYSYYAANYSERAPYQSLMVKNQLATYQNERYHDIFVYFPVNDKIISGVNSSLKADYYYDTYYAVSAEKDFREEFWEILEADARRPSFFVMNRESSDYYLCVSMKQLDYRNSAQSYEVVVVLEQGYINQLIEQENGEAGGIIMMFNQDKEILFSSDMNQNWHLEGYSGTEVSYQMELEGVSYMMQVQESDVLEGYYASAIPVDYFWQQLSQLRLLCGVSIGSCCVISVLIAYWNTLRAYKPVKNVVVRLQGQEGPDYNGRIYSEFEYITSLFEKQKEEWRLLNLKLKSSENLRRDRFLTALLEGSIEGDIYEACAKSGITLVSQRFLVGIIQVQSTKPDGMDLLSFIVGNVFEELCNREHRGYVVASSENHYTVLLNPRNTADMENLKEILEEGKLFLEQHYPGNVAIAVSEIHQGAKEIPDAYEEAMKTLRYRYLLGDKQILEFARIRNRRFSYHASAESRLSKMIIKYIREPEEQKEPKLFLEEILAMHDINEEASMETVECFKFEIASTINRAMSSIGYSTKEGAEAVGELLEKPTLEQFREIFTELLIMLRGKNQEAEEEQDCAGLAKRYIEEHFSDPGLSVVMIGEQVGRSGGYVSKLFRKRYGISIPGYVMSVRIHNANPMMKRREKTHMKRKRVSQVLSILLTCAMAVGMMGCGGDAEDNDREAQVSENEQSSQIGDGEAVEITYPLQTEDMLTVWSKNQITPATSYADYTESPFHTGLAENTGVEVEWQFPAEGADATQAYNLLLTEEELPDIIFTDITSSEAQQLIDDGVIYDLTDYLPIYAPDYWETIHKEEYANVLQSLTTDSGSFYGVENFCESLYNITYTGPVIRQDWLDECGLETPVTLDDWENVLITFKENYGAALGFTMARMNMSGLGSGTGAYASFSASFYVDDNGWFCLERFP